MCERFASDIRKCSQAMLRKVDPTPRILDVSGKLGVVPHLEASLICWQGKERPCRPLDQFQGRRVLVLQLEDTQEHQQSCATDTARPQDGTTRLAVSVKIES